MPNTVDTAGWLGNDVSLELEFNETGTVDTLL